MFLAADLYTAQRWLNAIGACHEVLKTTYSVVHSYLFYTILYHPTSTSQHKNIYDKEIKPAKDLRCRVFFIWFGFVVIYIVLIKSAYHVMSQSGGSNVLVGTTSTPTTTTDETDFQKTQSTSTDVLNGNNVLADANVNKTGTVQQQHPLDNSGIMNSATSILATGVYICVFLRCSVCVWNCDYMYDFFFSYR